MANKEMVDKKQTPASDVVLAQICDALRGLRFGSIHIVVQDGVVVQIDRTEKRRLARLRKPSND
jgi:hypothetical protein